MTRDGPPFWAARYRQDPPGRMTQTQSDVELAVAAFKAKEYEVALVFADRALRQDFRVSTLKIVALSLFQLGDHAALRQLLGALDTDLDPDLTGLGLQLLVTERRWPDLHAAIRDRFTRHGLDAPLTQLRDLLAAKPWAIDQDLLAYVDGIGCPVRLPAFWAMLHSALPSLSEAAPAAPPAKGLIYIDATCFLDNLRHGGHLTGIQRSILELLRALAADSACERVRVSFFARHSGAFLSVALTDFIAHLEQVGLKQLASDLLLSAPADHPLSGLLSGLDVSSALPGPSDTLFVMDVFWSVYFSRLHSAFSHYPCRKLLFVHDLIGINLPQENAVVTNRRFAAALPRMVALADGLVAQSQATRTDLTRFLATQGLQKPVFALRFAHARIAPDGPLGQIESDTLKRLAGRRFLLSVGTLSWRKGFVELAEAFAAAIDRLPADAVLVLAGRFQPHLPEAAQLTALFERHPDRMMWLNVPSDTLLDQLYRACWGVALLSYAEGWGLPVSEGLAYGKPLIVSDRTSLPEVAGDAAHYVDPAKPGQVQDAVLRLFLDRGFHAGLRALSETAPKRDWADVAADLLAITATLHGAA